LAYFLSIPEEAQHFKQATAPLTPHTTREKLLEDVCSLLEYISTFRKQLEYLEKMF
jgi:hypothetical protein